MNINNPTLKDFEENIHEHYNEKFKVLDKRQDPGYGYSHIWLVEVQSTTDPNFKMGLLFDLTQKEDLMIQNDIQLEHNQTIWDVPIIK